jgi:hypothetical protein
MLAGVTKLIQEDESISTVNNRYYSFECSSRRSVLLKYTIDDANTFLWLLYIMCWPECYRSAADSYI